MDIKIKYNHINNADLPNLHNYINNIGKFLAIRDIDNLFSESLYDKYNIKKVDILILLGNAIPYSLEVAYSAYNNRLCDKILISGGIGHSTQLLRSAIKTNCKFHGIKTEDKSEADIFKELLVNYYKIPKEKIIVENQSTNCGDNALKSINLLNTINIDYNSLLIIQDPTMQLRSYASFLKYLKNRDIIIINYAPFIPTLDANMLFTNKNIDGIWSINRYLDLIVGEIPRLRDDENGYGPSGKNFISHIDIPDYILNNYNKIITYINNSR